MSEASAPASTAAKPKRSFFNRPKWAAANREETTVKAPQTPVHDNDFFSRSHETYAAIAAEEEEREKRRLERRAQKKAASSTQVDNSRPSPKRRRIRTEVEDDTSDGGDHLSDFEVVEEDGGDHLSDFEVRDEDEVKDEVAAVQTGAQAKSKATLEQGKEHVRDGMIKLGMDSEQMRCPSPGSLPGDAPRIPTDEDCDRIRSKNKKLGPYDNATIRRLALRKWEQKHGGGSQMSTPNATQRVTRSLAQSASSESTPTTSNGGATPRPQPNIIDLADDDDNPDGPPQSAVSFASSYATAPVVLSQGSLSCANILEQHRRTVSLEQSPRETAQQRQSGAPVVSPSQATAGPARATAAAEVGTDTNSAGSKPGTEPAIQLLVTSEIPGTRALVIKRDIGQRFKEVREYWSNANNLPPEVKSKVYLKWKKRRLYDSQNCKRLGFTAGPDGSVVWQDPEDDIFDDYHGKIHLVAVVDGMSGPEPTTAIPPVTGTEPAIQTSSAPLPAPTDTPEPELRIIIRAKGYPECKLIVKPSTLIQRLIFAFKKNGKIPDGKNVALMFDGELLQHNATVGQTDIDDMGQIDAYVR